MKKIITILSILLLVMTLNITVYASNQEKIDNEIQAYALNSFTGQQLEQISDIEFTENMINFEYSGKKFSFPIQSLNIDTSDGRNISGGNFFTGNANGLVCNVVEYEDNCCIQVFDKSETVEARKSDTSNNFTIIVGRRITESLNDISSTIKSTNEEKQITQSIQRAVNGQLHVYVSGTTVPFLVSGGSAEGWCFSLV